MRRTRTARTIPGFSLDGMITLSRQDTLEAGLRFSALVLRDRDAAENDFHLDGGMTVAKLGVEAVFDAPP
jgi:hypothetical protein